MKDKKQFSSRAKISLVLTIIFHIIFIFCIPWGKLVKVESLEKNKKDLLLNIEKWRFVEPNLNLSIQEPDDTKNIASKSQQAAQSEKSYDKIGDYPDFNGTIMNSQSILEKIRAAKSIEFLEEYIMPEISKNTNNFVENLSNKQNTENNTRINEVIPSAIPPPITYNRPKPLPRPPLPNKVIDAPVMKTNTRVTRVGKVAIDAKMTSLGIYQQKMLEAVSSQWNLLARHAKFVEQDICSQVVIEFALNQEGSVVDIAVISSTATMSATLLCQDAIQSLSPFGPLPKDEIAIFEPNKKIRIHFFYR